MPSNTITRTAPLALITAFAFAGAGCAAPSSPEAQTTEAAPAQSAEPVQVAQLTYPNFAAWRADFRRRAAGAGVSGATFDRAFAGVGVNERVLELDGRQPEFTRPIWEYL
ncbi:MAG: lytic murein transglycosylase, partial [Pseudomonadota bacterium]